MVRRDALVCAHLLCAALLSAPALAQNAPGILPAGDAAVAGFSGTAVLGPPPPPEPKRIDKTYIDLDGPSLRVVGLGRMGGPPQAQLVPAPKLFTATARQIGQVFSLALDDADPPNIYAAASSAYGLPIVVPDADGDGVPDRSRRGAPNAAFMPGLFGPITLDGGPGSIWKINGSTGAVTLFANVTLGGVPNSGPALGGLAFDPASHQLFVADRDTGMIHRFTLDGVERGRFDHGTQALGAAGLPPIAFDPRKRLNIESPAFDSGNPGTWAYAPPARRVFGMAVNRGRLYYAVAAGRRIWSVSLLPDGSFGPDPRFEVTVPRSASQSAEISEILFDDDGDMLVAERGAPTGAYDYKTLAESPENRVLRFRPKGPDDPPSRDLWFPVPKEYAIGFPPAYRNDNGGIAIGYGYDAAGNINRAVCGGTLWSTGEQLRNARDRAIIQRLQAGGPLIVDGLQGNSTQLLRPLNEPPFETYFIDYDDRLDDAQTRGTLGDVVIWRVCGQAMLPILPVAAMCPPGLFDIDGICQFPQACPSGTEFSNGCCVYRGCPASYVRINGKCVPPPSHCKPDETYANGRCQAPTCPAGLVPVKGATNSNGNGPINALPNISGSNAALNDLKAANSSGGQPKMCGGSTFCKCPDGTQVSEDGTCKKTQCPAQTIEINGVCCTRQDLTNGKCQWRQPPPPKLTIDKGKPKSCEVVTTGALVGYLGGPIYLCKFLITIKNDGTTPASGATFTDAPAAPARIVDFGALDNNGNLDPNSRSWACNDPANAPLTCKRQPGYDIPAGGSVQVVVAEAVLVSASTGTVANCAAIGDTPVTKQGQPGALARGSNVSITSPAGQQLVDALDGNKTVDCKSVEVELPPPQVTTCTPTRMPPCSGSSNNPTGQPLCHLGECDCPLIDGRRLCGPSTCMTTCPASGTQPLPPPPPPPPTITVTCPEGTRMGLNGQCFFVDPGCKGPNCGTTGCPGGGQRNSDGNCPTPTTACTGGKVFDGTTCRCGFGMTDKNGTCVRTGTETKKPKKTRRTPRPSDSDNPAPSGSSPQFNIQIGPGFPGGGRPSGGKPGGGNPKGGSCGKSCG